MLELTLKEFVDITASSDPVPGGGSISALAAALSAALSEMVASLTIGKEKYAEVQPEMKVAAEGLARLRAELLGDVQKDSEAFDLYMQALKLPKNTEEERSIRKKAMQEGLKKAAEAPLCVSKKSVKLMDYAELVVNKGNKNAITDGMIAAMLARTAVLGAALNVRINLNSIEDEEYTRLLEAELSDIEDNIKQREEILLNAGIKRLYLK